ncbi:hypothetical protein OIU79_021902 [Salix purpurea]|uniref:Uncharacterized protein n=1 Tax=Salix purpurea TaxID=77065 RepID=A0A9Q0WEI8_SALPP|nr:hypothetical protein OIU79_021902 [Salix purpurea]
MTRKQKPGQSKAHEGEQSPKKKAKNGKKNDSRNGKSEDNIAIKSMKSSVKLLESTSIEQMREILDMNDQDSSGSNSVVTTKWQVNPGPAA